MTEPDVGPETGRFVPARGDAARSPGGAARRPATDAHVHLLPARLQAAIRDALAEAGGWTVDHPVERAAMEARLRAAGVERYLALPYVHEAGMAADLNDWLLAQAADSELAVPFATVHADDDVAAVVRDAFAAGARGLKFQCPVQGSAPDDPELFPAYELAADYDRPVVFHAGPAPHFHDSPHVGADRFESFLDSFPDVRACAAHMGADECDAFLALSREHENAFLDTSVAMSAAAPDLLDFDPRTVPDSAFEDLAGSVMYGSDYPNVPYDYGEERADLLARGLSDEAYRALFRGAAERFLGE